MGNCFNKKKYDIENHINTNIKQFEGLYINNKKEGYCIEYNINGEKIFEGQFINNKKNGLGIILNNNVKIFEGYWKNDIING